ncbi:bifunctional 2-polyprenyl-6-hydroxyphenol methylase/3-demethylubiquinol 3-O-methyltransferase UbiG [Flavivirga sp. 57AJ16]|uniref:class I SAM-dependent methyltransferase n=1 Tax=Flavivirga sp. 57AJ16 TaxID=3025307 RepID=UPI0023662F9B|nr:class I SAM-dependent methyltransferase [Flavivirga sp. 57AJ16]MDD7885175.1 class I SAM-dependent methyltransferase [Flavivirga sp. 57AJ16]
MTKKIINKVDRYYSEKIIKHGATSHGVDWNGKESQFLRFEQLGKVFKSKKEFSLLDYGCGYGSFIDYLSENNFKNIQYFGYDISSEMLKQAKASFSKEDITFMSDLQHLINVDYTIASGIFNVKLDTDEKDWKIYIEKTLNTLNDISELGFSFNILTSFSDEEYKKDYLFYADPMFYFNYCKNNFSRNVAVLHDYDLYEFTIIVRK